MPALQAVPNTLQDPINGQVDSAKQVGGSKLSWRLRDIDWAFVFRAQHYGTAGLNILILVALAIVHYAATPANRPAYIYDATIGFFSPGDTFPAWTSVIVPLVCFGLSLLIYEFWVYRRQNVHITNAVATIAHFSLDVICAFVTVLFVTESTKLLAGRLRPNFLSACQPSNTGVLTYEALALCTKNADAERKSFPSGHASASAVTCVYTIVYQLWAGYMRSHDAAFLGLDRRSGWRGGHRLLRELGHTLYLTWMLLLFAYTWAVGVSRFVDNKHNISDVIGGWFLGTIIGIVYAVRACSLQKYVNLHDVNVPIPESRTRPHEPLRAVPRESRAELLPV